MRRDWPEADVLEVHRLEADARDAVAVGHHLARLPGQDLLAGP